MCILQTEKLQKKKELQIPEWKMKTKRRLSTSERNCFSMGGLNYTCDVLQEAREAAGIHGSLLQSHISTGDRPKGLWLARAAWAEQRYTRLGRAARRRLRRRTEREGEATHPPDLRAEISASYYSWKAVESSGMAVRAQQ